MILMLQFTIDKMDNMVTNTTSSLNITPRDYAQMSLITILSRQSYRSGPTKHHIGPHHNTPDPL